MSEPVSAPAVDAASARTDLALHDGTAIPRLGLGVFQIEPDQVRPVVERALAVGYRHIDTARAYMNEQGVGEAVRASGLDRDEVFVTTKLRNGDQGYESTFAAYEDSSRRLGFAPDLYLIHWPYPSAGLYRDSWRALTELAADGRVRSIGVSNFLPDHLDALAADTDVVPVVNQIELHPTLQQADVVARCRDAGIAVEAYSPLGQGADLDADAVTAAARAHDATPAQVVIAWHLAQGFVVIPKTRTPERLQENFESLQLQLTADEVDAISALESGQRIGGDPATFSFDQVRD